MSAAGAKRRNNAGRKIRAAKFIDPEIKLAILAVIDLLNPESGYQVAWPSAATIANRLGRSRRSGLWYVKAIKATGIFHCHRLTTEEAIDFCDEKYGIHLKLERCGPSAPNLFVVNREHPLWNNDRKLWHEVDVAMGEAIKSVKARRNMKTTSRLAASADKRPAPRLDVA